MADLIGSYLKALQDKQLQGTQNTVLGRSSNVQSTVLGGQPQPGVSSPESAHSVYDPKQANIPDNKAFGDIQAKTSSQAIDNSELSNVAAQGYQPAAIQGSRAAPISGEAQPTIMSNLQEVNSAYKVGNQAYDLGEKAGKALGLSNNTAITGISPSAYTGVAGSELGTGLATAAYTGVGLESGGALATGAGGVTLGGGGAITTGVGEGVALSGGGAISATEGVGALAGEGGATLGGIVGGAATGVGYAAMGYAAREGLDAVLKNNADSNAFTGEMAKELDNPTVEGTIIDATERFTGHDFGGTAELLSDPVGTILQKAGTVICTELYRQGLLTDNVYFADALYGNQQDDDLMTGYRLFGVPLAREMSQSKIITKIVSFFAIPWAQQMAYEMNINKKGNLLVKCLMKSLYPVVRLIGKTRRIFNG